MEKYDGKHLLKEIEHSNVHTYLNYYGFLLIKVFLPFFKFDRQVFGEIFLTDDALYVFHRTKRIVWNPEEAGVKIDRKDILSVQLVESRLHLFLTQKGYDVCKEFFKIRPFFCTKSYEEDPELNTIIFNNVDEKEAMRLLEDFGGKSESKIEIKQVKIEQPKKDEGEVKSDKKLPVEKIDIPPKLLTWANTNRKYEDGIVDIDWKILTFLYKRRNIDSTIKTISDGIGESYTKTQSRVRRLHNRLQLLKGRPKLRQKNEFWYFLPEDAY